MALNKKVAIEIEIKNIEKVSKLKKELKELRKEQKATEEATANGSKLGKKSAQQYSETATKIKHKSAELRKLNKDLRDSNDSTKTLTKANNGMAKQFIKGAAVIGVLVTAFRVVNKAISSVVSTFTEFEFVMAKVQAVSGATDLEFKKLTDSAEELGRTTFFTAEQVGQLQLAYSKLGFTANEILDAQKATLDLATATGTDLARAAQVSGAAIRGFGLDASEATRVVDVMAVSFSSSALDIEKWQTGMTKVAPIAKSAGFSIEDTAAMMAKLSDSGIEASIAGTSLRNILLKMQDPTSELSIRFGKTISGLDELVPAMKQFVAEGGSMADIMEVVDLRQAAAFEQMITSADGTLALRDSLLEANGEGERMAGIVGDTLQGAFLKLKSALQGVSIEVMKGFAEAMQSAIENAASFFNLIAKNGKTIVMLVKGITKLAKWFGIYKLVVFAVGGGLKQLIVTSNIYKTTAAKMTAMNAGLTLSFKSLGLAIKSLWSASGIGLLIVGLSELAPWLMKTNKETKKQLTLVEQVTDRYFDSIKPIEKLSIASKDLVRVKKLMNEMTDEEGKLLKDTAVNQKIYNQYKAEAAIATRTLNEEIEKNDQALLNEKSSIEDIIKATQQLTKSLTDQALAKAFTKEIEKITESAANATVTLQMIAEEFGVDPDQVADFFDETGDIIKESFGIYGENAQDVMATNNKLKLSYGEMLNILEKGGFKTFFDLQEAMNSVESNTESLIKTFDSLTESGSIADLVLKLMGKTSKDLIGKGLKDWSLELTDALNKIKQAYIDGALSAEEYKDEVLKARNKILQKELDSLKVVVRNEKRISEIKKAQLDIQIQQSDIAFNKEQKLLQDNYKTDRQIIKNENSINGKVTESGNLLLLQLEAQYLIDKGLLHENYKKLLFGINSQIAQNNQSLHDQNMKIIQEQISAMGGVGSALTTLAGENESLNKVKEVGVKISQAAAIAEAFLTLQKNLAIITDGKLSLSTLLGTKSKVANTAATTAETIATGANTVATTANTVIETASIVPKVASGAASQTKLPFPLNLIAVVATLALLSKIMKSFGDGGVVDTFANGGMVNGKSHAQGGEKFAVGGRVVELEGGEAVINKRSTSMFRNQLSSINEAGGGVKFADGGLMNMPSFASSQFNAIGQQNMMGAMNTSSRVVVVEADITNSQNTVGLIEAEATF